jgi:dipeptidyl aminopeptidase/acylaminoacyl peptidase
MPEQRVTFKSGTLALAGHLRLPAGLAEGERRPAFIVLHGFGSTMNATNVVSPCALFEELGYASLRFDMRGCGESEGERGNLICLEQVEDTRNALTFLQQQPAIDPDRIGVVGSSFGAAVAVYAGGVEKRIAAVISGSGFGHGERKFRGQHKTPEEWAKFTAMLAAGEGYRQKHGKPLMVPRYDIVPIPEHLRGHLAKGSILEFTWETARGMVDFRPEDVVANIAPRPLLLLHSAADSVTPTEQSIAMFAKAGQPADLHLFAETDHFMFAEHNTRVRSVVRGWLEKFFPVTERPSGGFPATA